MGKLSSINTFNLLRDGGLLPEKWGRKIKLDDLSSGQKSFYTKRVAELGALVRNRANFVVRKIGPKSVEKLKSQGFKVINGRAIIRTDFDGVVKIKNGVVHLIDVYETKIITGHSIKSLIDARKQDEFFVPFDVRMMEAKFTYGRDNWCMGIAGKPIGNFFTDFQGLMEWLESPEDSSDVINKLEQEGYGGQPHLMKVTLHKGAGAPRDFTRAALRKSANKAASKTHFRK